MVQAFAGDAVYTNITGINSVELYQCNLVLFLFQANAIPTVILVALMNAQPHAHSLQLHLSFHTVDSERHAMVLLM